MLNYRDEYELCDLPIPYIEQIKQCFKKYNGSRHFFLVAENEWEAKKAFAYIGKNLVAVDEEGGLGLNCCYEIQFSDLVGQDNQGNNPYLAGMLGIKVGDGIFYSGVEEGENLSKKLEIIVACASLFQCIWITPRESKQPWVAQFMMENDTQLFELEASGIKYYEQVVLYFLEKYSVKLEKGLEPTQLIQRMKNVFGKEFREEFVEWNIKEAAEYAAGENRTVLIKSDFHRLKFDYGINKLDSMIGLESIKKLALESRVLLLEEQSNPKLTGIHRNMIFYGNPGTGKTTCAQLLAQIMAETGNTNVRFIAPGRNELIGKYVGHTSPKIKKLFEDAEGGVLFVDEAGFFLNDGSGGFVQEAIKEFVRYMELYPNVTVIFALYDPEVENFLKLDDGLASRIAKMVHFPDYTPEQLYEIANHMLKEKGYGMSEAAQEICLEYFKKNSINKNFGNARAVRKLVEAIVVEISIRHMTEIEKGKKSNLVSEVDVQRGIADIKSDVMSLKRSIGFCCN